MSRIGVFICHCGTNIAGSLDVEAVAKASESFPGVSFATTYKYMCSEQGQQAIKDAIDEHGLDRIVIASCSPRMHEATFRKYLSATEINPYMLEIANIREQCSWVHTDPEKATEKAIDLVRMAVAKVREHKPLFTSSIPVTKKALIVGAGIAGIQAALDIADAGYQVTLLERNSSIGGHMIMLDKTFPTLDCSACISTPKMSEVAAHPNITLMTCSEVETIGGYVGNFEVTIRQKAKYVDYDLCTGCGLCETKCPVKVPNEFDQGLAKRSAIYRPFPQAVPAKPVIDAASCRLLTGGKCGVCKKLCPLDAINFEDEDKLITDTYGAIVIATGYDLIDWAALYPEYGSGRFLDVLSGLQFERLLNAAGPTEGKILRPSDGSVPKEFVIIKCVGSRDKLKDITYCSRACCMYTAKHAHQILEKIPDAKVTIFYMDVRTPGKSYEEFYDRTREDGARYLRGRVSKIYLDNGKLICKGEDTLIGSTVEVPADMVILATGMTPALEIRTLTGKLAISTDEYGWIQEAHPKLRPVETQTAGIYLAGACQGPKDIPDTVSQASAAASKVSALFSNDELEGSPMISCVTESKCCGCETCLVLCPYKAITMEDITSNEVGGRVQRSVAKVNAGLCQGCGCCTAACRTGAIDLLGFTNLQILKEVDALCQI